MKKAIFSVLVASVVAVAVSDQAEAQVTAQTAQITQVKPGALKAFAFTTIKGDITVPAPSTFTGSGYGTPAMIANFQCSNLIISASSKEMKPRPANYTGFWIDQPVWVHSAVATGTWSSGKCSYSINVPGGKEFQLVAGHQGGFSCSTIDIFVTNTPAWQSVPSGTTKVDNLGLKPLNCNVIG
jgi:hypothetical protein